MKIISQLSRRCYFLNQKLIVESLFYLEVGCGFVQSLGNDSSRIEAVYIMDGLKVSIQCQCLKPIKVEDKDSASEVFTGSYCETVKTVLNKKFNETNKSENYETTEGFIKHLLTQ